METADAKPTPRNRPGHLPGKAIIVATMSLFVLVPVITGLARVALLNLEPPPPPALNWAERQQWEAFEVHAATLERGLMSQGRTGEKYKDITLGFSPEVEAAMLRSTQLAQRRDFESPDVLDELLSISTEHPDLFYPVYLLALHAQHHGLSEESARLFQQAFELAPRAMIQRVLDEQGHPLAQQRSPTVAFALDQTQADRPVPTLVLIYPGQLTDRLGQVYWPVYEAIYRESDPTLPAGAISESVYYFAFPGQVGRLPDRHPPSATGPKP